MWSYLSSYDYGTPFLGNFHGSDALHIFFGIWPNKAMRSTRTCYFNFVYNLDPNIGVGSYSRWPQWKEKRELAVVQVGVVQRLYQGRLSQRRRGLAG